MIKIDLNGIHDFRKTHSFTRTDRMESFNSYRCVKCKLIGRRVNREHIIYVSDTYSKERIELCQKDKLIDKYVGKQIQISCKIIANEALSNISIYSVHTIVAPPSKKEINGESGVWVMGSQNFPVKVFFDEYVDWPIHPRKNVIKRVRGKKYEWGISYDGCPIKVFPKVKRVRTKIKRVRTKIKRTRTKMKRIRTIIKPKRKRTKN